MSEEFKQLHRKQLNFLVLVTSSPGAPHSNSSTSLQTGGSVFGGSKDGMHQRSFSVSSADQWNEAINTSTSSAARKYSTLLSKFTSYCHKGQNEMEQTEGTKRGAVMELPIAQFFCNFFQER